MRLWQRRLTSWRKPASAVQASECLSVHQKLVSLVCMSVCLCVHNHLAVANSSMCSMDWSSEHVQCTSARAAVGSWDDHFTPA